MGGKPSYIRLFAFFILTFFSPFLSPVLAQSPVLTQKLTQAHLGETAHVVDPGKLLVALRQMSYGAYERVSIETVPLYNLLGSWNLFGKVNVLEQGPLSIAGRAGFFYVTWEQLPEIKDKPLTRYYVGGIASLNVSPVLDVHLNVSNTSLYGDLLSSKKDLQIQNKLVTFQGDVDYALTDQRHMLVGTGYDVLTKKVSVGGSHLWQWATFYVKLGMTFKTAMTQGVTLLPYFDVGILL